MGDGINDESIIAAVVARPRVPSGRFGGRLRSWVRPGRLHGDRKVLEDALGVLLGGLYEKDSVPDSAEQPFGDLVVDIKGDARCFSSRLDTGGQYPGHRA